MKAILFDLDGVFYQGDKLIPGADKVATWVKEQGIPHLFLTNTTSKSRAALQNKLEKFGIHTDAEHILTPPIAAVRWLRLQQIENGLALFVPEDIVAEFSDFPLLQNKPQSDIAAVILGDLGEQWDFALLNQAFRYLIAEPSPLLIALGMTRYWQAEDGLRLDVGPFVMALEYASDVKPIVMGKPSPDFYQTALDLLNVKGEETIMIGDDIYGDIRGAQQAGLRTALVKTGKFRPTDLTKNITPDIVLDSVNDLPNWWISPHFSQDSRSLT